MVRGQVNEQIVNDLSTTSKYLRRLDDHFSGLVSTRHMRLFWAYETMTSPTPEKQEDGSYARSGPQEILVTKESATRSHYHLRTPETFPINENHSDMIKFRQDDRNFHVVMSKLREICGHYDPPTGEGSLEANQPNYPAYMISGTSNEHEGQADRNKPWHLKLALRARVVRDLRKSLEVPGLDNRFETIDDRFSRTFEWIFDENSVISQWIKEGSGMFWIHGKPASGKSTLMKFIFKSQQTWELLHSFSSEALQITSAFFFHDRGSLFQRSFEGLLRSILHQILQESDRLAVLVADDMLARHSTTRFPPKVWTIKRLESCIHFLLRQNHAKLDLFFVFDALDEYDGQPEFICKILKEMINAVTDSPNTLKILFSSRPWDVFKRNFGDLPSLQLQDYTKDDIREYCMGIVEREGEAISVALDPVISKVIERANGVFLWVKLVLLELIAEATKGKRAEELSRILGGIPDDLRDYYTRIIQRTPEKSRWDAYVIFYAIAQGRDSLGLEDLIRIVACSRSPTYQDARQRLEEVSEQIYLADRSLSWKLEQLFCTIINCGKHRINHTSVNTVALEQRKNHMITITGGLIEFVKANPSRTPASDTAQLAHQTVREFVIGHDFKQCILRHDARTIYENGHTFLARYGLAKGDLASSALSLFLHESTTGQSLLEFLDSVPDQIFHGVQKFTFASERLHDLTVDPLPIEGHLSFAVCNNLQLYLEDTLQRKSNVLKETKEALSPLFPNPELESVGVSPLGRFQVQLTILRYLFNNGYTVQQDPKALKKTMQAMMQYEHQSVELYHNNHRFLEEKATILIRHGEPANTPLYKSNYKSRPNNLRTMIARLIHIATTTGLIDCLLEMGVDVNTPDKDGNSPLDYALAHWHDDEKMASRLMHFSEKWSNTEIDRVIQRITHLVDRGGAFKTTPRHVWEFFIADVEERGFDTSPTQKHSRRSLVLACVQDARVGCT